MKKRPIALAACLLLAACASSTPSPAGWQPKPGATGLWTSSAGDQTYSYSHRPFTGTLQDLASQEAINVVLRYKGSHFVRSVVFTPCPGMAAVASFTYGGNLLEEGFGLQNGQAVLVAYVRPKDQPSDVAADAAMEKALCVANL